MIRESSFQLPQAEQEVPGLKEMAGHIFRFVQGQKSKLAEFVQKIDQPYLLKSLEKGLAEEKAALEALESTMSELQATGVVNDATHWQLEHGQTELAERKQFIRTLTERRDALLERQ